MTLESKNGAVGLCSEHPMDIEFVEALSGTLNEWSSAHDEDAYRSLLAGELFDSDRMGVEASLHSLLGESSPSL